MYKITTVTKTLFTTLSLIEAEEYFDKNKHLYSYIELKEVDIRSGNYYSKSLKISYK